MGRWEDKEEHPIVIRSRGGKLLFMGLTICGTMFIINILMMGISWLLQ